MTAARPPRLTAEQRSAIVALRNDRGWTFKDIASQLGRREETVREAYHSETADRLRNEPAGRGAGFGQCYCGQRWWKTPANQGRRFCSDVCQRTASSPGERA